METSVVIVRKAARFCNVFQEVFEPRSYPLPIRQLAMSQIGPMSEHYKRNWGIAMAKRQHLAQLLGVTVLACSSPPIAADEPSPPCMSVAAVREEACPPNWSGVLATAAAWCGQPRDPLASMDVSPAPCRGFLRYHHAYVTAGHFYCLYDPFSLALRGYYGFDRKLEQVIRLHSGAFANSKAEDYGEITCGMSRADFEDTDCEHVSCP